MKRKKISEPGPEGGLTIFCDYLERDDSVENLEFVIGDHKIIDELVYMGVKNVGQFLDEFDEIIKRVVDRFPSFFDDGCMSAEEIKHTLEASMYDDKEEKFDILSESKTNDFFNKKEIEKRNQLKEEMLKQVNTLPELEQKVIRLRYGLDDNQPKTLLEVGKILGITRERVRQLEMKAIEKLREANK